MSEFNVERCGLGLGTYGVRITHGPLTLVLSQKEALLLARGILPLVREGKPLKRKERGSNRHPNWVHSAVETIEEIMRMEGLDWNRRPSHESMVQAIWNNIPPTATPADCDGPHNSGD